MPVRQNGFMKLQGVLAPLTTPFRKDGSLALDQLTSNVARYNRTRLAGYVVVGSTGESVLLSANEVERVWAAVHEAAAPEKILVAGTGVETTAETISRCRRAAEIGYQAVLVKPPHYFKSAMTSEALERHYRSVADSSPVPVVLYNIPQNTGVPLTADLVARLSGHPNILGIKESSGNVPLLAEIVQSAPGSFQALAGSAAAFLGSLVVGAAGGILGVACFLPELCVEIYDAWRGGDTSRARRAQEAILPAARRVVAELGPGGVKWAMDRAGYFGGPPRLPLLPLTDSQRGTVETALKGLLPAAARAD
jgi:4-hydroxy-2-oxoglutarate aldolase